MSVRGGLRRLEVREDEGLLYIETCPECGGSIPEPFVPPADEPYPMVYTHQQGYDFQEGHPKPSCRVRLIVHPEGVIDGERVGRRSYERALLGGT